MVYATYMGMNTTPAIDPEDLFRARKHSWASFNPKRWATVINALPGWKWESVGTRLEPKFVVTAPNGKTHRIEKLAGYRVVTFYKFTPWLLKDTSFEADLAQVLGMEKYDPSAVYVRTREGTGTCPACFRNIKLDAAQKMVHHGYQRPGIGYIVGDCFCVGYLPYELSSEGTKAFLERAIRPALDAARGYLKALKGDKITQFERKVEDHSQPRDNRTWRFPVKKIIVREGENEEPGYSFKNMLESAIRETEHRVKSISADVKAYETLIADWKLAPLPEAGKKVKDGR